MIQAATVNFPCVDLMQDKSPEIMCWNQILNVLLLEGEAFRRWLGHEGKALDDGFSAL